MIEPAQEDFICVEQSLGAEVRRADSVSPGDVHPWPGDQVLVVAREGEEIKSALDDLQERMRELEAERKRLVELCDRSLVSKYERIRKQRGGVAVVPVVGGTCKGCQRNVPPQMANQLLTGNDILTCPNCHRFIYAADEPQAAANV